MHFSIVPWPKQKRCNFVKKFYIMQLLYKHNGFTAYNVNIINSFNIGRRFVVIVDGFKFYRFQNFNVTNYSLLQERSYHPFSVCHFRFLKKYDRKCKQTKSNLAIRYENGSIILKLKRFFLSL